MRQIQLLRRNQKVRDEQMPFAHLFGCDCKAVYRLPSHCALAHTDENDYAKET